MNKSINIYKQSDRNRKLQRSKHCHRSFEFRLKMLNGADCGTVGCGMTSSVGCLPALLGRWRQYLPQKHTQPCDAAHCPVTCCENLKSHSQLSCVRTLLSLLFGFQRQDFISTTVVWWCIRYCLYLYLLIFFNFILLFVYGVQTFSPEAKLYQ